MISRTRKILTKRIWKIPVFLLLVVVFGAYIIVSVMVNIPEFTPHILIFDVWTDKETYELNETIEIHLLLINPTLSVVDLIFRNSYTHDYIILNQNNNELYQMSNDFRFFQAITHIRIGPLSSHKRTYKHLPKFYLLQLGKYTIRGVIVGYGLRETRFAKETTIEVLET